MNHLLRGVAISALALSLSSLGGCVSKTTTQGVRNLWRGEAPPKFELGKSTQDDVLRALGPPSQVISLADQTVFYYMLEQHDSRTAVFIVYNRTETNVIYDRAIFFFDAQGRLKEFATSDEQIGQKQKTK